MAIIDFDNVTYSYDGKRDALASTTLSVEQGTFTCVLGGNGSGKSTLAKHINALLKPDSGTVRVMGLDSSDPENVFSIRSNAGMVFQNPDDQIVASVIENDVAFGPENLGVPTEDLRARVEAALAQVGLQGFEKKQTETLSGGQKQRVAVAGVLAMKPQVLVLDEASAMLDPRGRAGLMRVCRELNDAGMTIVLITHFMEEAARADRVIVLEDGAVALDGPPREVLLQAKRLAKLALDIPFATRLSMKLRDLGAPVGMHADEEGLIDELVGLLGACGPKEANAGPHLGQGGGKCESLHEDNPPSIRDNEGEDAQDEADEAVCGNSKSAIHGDGGAAAADSGDEAARGKTGAPAIEFANVSFTYEPVSQAQRRKSSVAPSGKQADWGRSPDEYWALKDLSFAVESGEFFGIAGHTGSGKSTLIQLANGLLKPAEGTVSVSGHALTSKKTASEARSEIGVVFQYPEHQLFAATVFDDVAFGPRNLGYSNAKIEESVRIAMDMVHLDLDDLRDRNPFELSGGQQRRVAFAGVLAMNPHTLVLDEPVAGLDPRAKRLFLKLLKELHDEQGLTVVVVSHNMDDLAQLCDRILVLNEGRAHMLGTPETVFADEQALKSVGLGVPQASHVAGRLASAGMPLSVGCVPSIDELAQAISACLPPIREGC